MCSSPVANWNITEVRGREGLAQVEADWRRIYARIPRRTAFLAFETITGYLDHVHKAPSQVRCLLLGDGREVRAICLLEPRRDLRLKVPVDVWGVFWISHDHQANILCADDEARRALIPAVTSYLEQRAEGRSLLVLGPAPSASALWEGLDPARSCLDPKPAMKLIPCDRPYKDLLADLPRKFRYGLKSCLKKMEELEGAGFVDATGGAELASEFETFLQVEASGWKGAARSSLVHRHGRPAFFRGLTAEFTDPVDHCEIHAFHAEGRCLATTFCTRTGGVVTTLKIAYDESYARFSPGQVVLARLIELCCADPDIQVVDMVGDAPWLRGWSIEEVPLDLAYVNLGGLKGWALLRLLRIRLGLVRSAARWIRSLKPMKGN